MSPASPASHYNRLSVAERIIPVVGGLYRDNGVVTHIHGRSLIGCSPEQLLKAHRFARHAGGEELDLNQTLELLTALYKSAFTGEIVRRGSILPSDPFYTSLHGGRSLKK